MQWNSQAKVTISCTFFHLKNIQLPMSPFRNESQALSTEILFLQSVHVTIFHVQILISFIWVL